MSLFKRKTKRSVGQQIVHMCWPVMGWKRTALYYLYRLKRLKDQPLEVSMGIATGVASSFTPFIGFQILAALGVNSLLKGSSIATLVGTLFGNPWTFPFIWFGMFKFGRFIMAYSAPWVPWPPSVDLAHLPPLSFHFLWTHYGDVLIPMLIASVPLTFLAWVTSFLLIYTLMRMLKSRPKTGQKFVKNSK